jgi:hypothetical protein
VLRGDLPVLGNAGSGLAQEPTAVEGGGEIPATSPAVDGGSEGDEGDEQNVAAPPAARRVQLFYDDTTFYAANPNADELEIASLSFATLAGDGSATSYAFSGESWAAYYPFVQPGYCDRLHIVNTPIVMEPAACAGFNAWMTPAAGEDIVFWRAREGVEEFAVYWDGIEVGRCAIAAGSCEAPIP